MITKKELHEAEMYLVSSCENLDIDRFEMKDIIINKFTDLIAKAK